MKLVVVVPAYNAAEFLPNLVHRLVAAKPPGLFRIVIVDDGSTDSTAQTAQDLAKTIQTSKSCSALPTVATAPR